MNNEIYELVTKVVKAIDDKLGQDIIVLDLKNLTTLCDYFIIASSSSTRQVKAIADEIKDQLQEDGISALHKEGYDQGRWILLDYGDIVIHVFHQEDRDFYNIEGIWKDATIINIDKIIGNDV